MFDSLNAHHFGLVAQRKSACLLSRLSRFRNSPSPPRTGIAKRPKAPVFQTGYHGFKSRYPYHVGLSAGQWLSLQESYASSTLDFSTKHPMLRTATSTSKAWVVGSTPTGCTMYNPYVGRKAKSPKGSHKPFSMRALLIPATKRY